VATGSTVRITMAAPPTPAFTACHSMSLTLCYSAPWPASNNVCLSHHPPHNPSAPSEPPLLYRSLERAKAGVQRLRVMSPATDHASCRGFSSRKEIRPFPISSTTYVQAGPATHMPALESINFTFCFVFSRLSLTRCRLVASLSMKVRPRNWD
jgi:hypothetical protein